MTGTRSTLLLVLALAAVGIAVSLWLHSRAGEVRAVDLARETGRSSVRPELAPSRSLAAEPEIRTQEERTPVVTEPEEVVVEERAGDDEEAGPSISITARFVDREGYPLPGVELAATSLEASPAALSDAAGEAELLLPWEDLRGFFPQGCMFSFREKRHVSVQKLQHFRRVEDVFLGQFTLEPGGGARGRVVDEAGRPVAGASVIATDVAPEELRDELRIWGGLQSLGEATTSEGDGAFLLEGIVATRLVIAAQGTGTFFGHSEPVTIEVGEIARIPDIVVPRAPSESRIEGIVRTESGRPVYRARVRLQTEGRGRGRAWTDERGWFGFVVDASQTYKLQILDYSTNGWPDILVEDVQPGTTDLELVFQDTVPLRIVVRSRDGKPVRRFNASVSGSDGRTTPGGWGNSEDGAPLELRRPPGPFRASVYAPGYEWTKQSFDPAEVGDEITFVLEPTTGIFGRVLAGGEPLAGVTVDGHPPLGQDRGDEERIMLTEAGFHLRINPRMVIGDRTGPDGEFFLNVPREATLVVHAQIDGYARAEAGPFQMNPEEGSIEVDFALVPGGALEGRLFFSGEGDPAGRTVAVSRADGHIESQVVGADGGFRFENLTPGPYQVRECNERELELALDARAKEWLPASDPIPWDVTVVSGGTARFDVNLTEVCRFEGLLKVNGGNPVGWSWGVEGVPGYERHFDAEGAFEFEVDEPGKRRLQVKTARTSTVYSAFVCEPELQTGLNTWERDIATGTVELSGLLARDPADVEFKGQMDLAYMLIWEDDTGLSWFANVIAAREGRLKLTHVPAGRIRVTNQLEEFGGRNADVLHELELELAPGETKTIEL